MTKDVNKDTGIKDEQKEVNKMKERRATKRQKLELIKGRNKKYKGLVELSDLNYEEWEKIKRA